MLIRKLHFLLLFFTILMPFGVKGSDSVLHASLYREIDMFKYSNQKKYLHALISNEIGILTKTGDSDYLLKLKYSFVKHLLNNQFQHETFQLLKEIENEIDLYDPNLAQEFYYWMGVAYFRNSQFEEALNYYKRAENESKKTLDQTNLGLIYYHIGALYVWQGKRDMALPFYLKANSAKGCRLDVLADSKRRISSTYSLRKEHEKALNYINEALALYAHTDSIKTLNDSIWDYGIYADFLQSRAYVYREMAKGRSDSLVYLKKSFADAKTSMFLFEKYKRTLVFESDLIFANKQYGYFHSKSIEAISRIYDITHDKTLLKEALQYAELGKSSALVRTVQKDIALNQSNIPDSTVVRIKSLYEHLSEVEAKRFEENANSRVSDTALYTLNLELYNLVSEITLLEKQLERNYPLYAESKYKVTSPNIDFIIEESHNKAILEFVVSNEKLYTFLIVDGEIHFNHFYFNDDFIASIERLQSMISDINAIDFSLQELHEFETLSFGLYKVLLQPFEALIEGKQLLIVPDDLLSLIPFEILLSENTVSNSLNYSMLPYLVKTHDISYAYSLTLSHKQREIKIQAKNDQLLAMAPGYEKLAGNEGPQYVALRSAFRDARDQLGLLEGAQAEVKRISRNLKGKLILEDKASEEQFKLTAPNYKVLHLAMHTLINNDDPLYSKLVFTPDVDEFEDGLLNTYELSNMELNAELVVLSACNTGFGKLNKGEGIIGLSRGFLQAGCKSLLATLWSVADEASVDLISDFYEGLRNNEVKSASLSKAKRNYLSKNTGINSHPFFWAGYISIGNDDALMLDKNNRNLILVLLVIFLLIGGFTWRIYYVKSRKIIPAFSQTKQKVS